MTGHDSRTSTFFSPLPEGEKRSMRAEFPVSFRIAVVRRRVGNRE